MRTAGEERRRRLRCFVFLDYRDVQLKIATTYDFAFTARVNNPLSVRAGDSFSLSPPSISPAAGSCRVLIAEIVPVVVLPPRALYSRMYTRFDTRGGD